MTDAAANDAQDEQVLLRQFLAGRDVACPQCEYNVRDLRGNICPECGQQLSLRLRLTETRQAALLTGLVGLSAGVGLSGLLLIYYFLIMYVRGMRGGAPTRFFNVTAGGFVVLGALLFTWLRAWRWLRTSPPAVRWTLAGACWLTTLAYLLIFTFTIR